MTQLVRQVQLSLFIPHAEIQAGLPGLNPLTKH